MAADRNQNVKNQLLKKRDEASRRKIPLAPGEMVDDAMARGLAGAGRWLKANFGLIQWVIVVGVVAGIGYAIYDNRANKRAEAASAELLKGAVAERGRILGSSSTPKPDEAAPDDPTPVFKSVEERRETALAAYRKVTSSHAGTGAAILARMGEAGLLLDQRDWEGALAAYRDVRASPLAAADVTVRGRALEGIGIALEGKGDIEGALKSFRELENTDTRGLKELGMYHQARILYGKGDTDKSKELLKAARERLKGTESSSKGPLGESRPFGFLESQVEDLLRRIDPAALVTTATAPSPASGGESGKSATSENLQRIQQELQRKMKEKAEKSAAEKGGLPVPAPPPAGTN